MASSLISSSRRLNLLVTARNPAPFYLRIAHRTVAIRTDALWLRKFLLKVLGAYRVVPFSNADILFDVRSRPAPKGHARLTASVLFHPRFHIPPQTPKNLKFHRKKWPIFVFYLGTLEPLLHAALRSVGVHPMHAVALYKGKKGVLICGAARAGKTTTALHFIAKGWKLMNDDDSYLVCRGKKTAVWASQGTLYPRLDARRHYPGLFEKNAAKKIRRRKEWRFAIQNPKRGCKRFVAIDTVFFPQVKPVEPSRIEPLTPKEALIQLLGQRSRGFRGMRKDEFAATRACEILFRLAGLAKGANLVLGRDPSAVADVLNDFMGGRPKVRSGGVLKDR